MLTPPNPDPHPPAAAAKRISLIAGGTGITPCFQVIRAICEDPEDTTLVRPAPKRFASFLLARCCTGHALDAAARCVYRGLAWLQSSACP